MTTPFLSLRRAHPGRSLGWLLIAGIAVGPAAMGTPGVAQAEQETRTKTPGTEKPQGHEAKPAKSSHRGANAGRVQTAKKKHAKRDPGKASKAGNGQKTDAATEQAAATATPAPPAAKPAPTKGTPAAGAAGQKDRPKAAARPKTRCTLKTKEAPRGGRLEVSGSQFGQAALVRINGQVTRLIERTGDTIAVQIPAKSNGGPVSVQVGKQRTPCGSLTIIGLD